MFLIYLIKTKNFGLSLSHFFELWLATALTRPCFDNNSMHKHEELGHFQAMISHDYNFGRHVFIFPIIWRLAEYIAVCILMVDDCYIQCNDGRPKLYVDLLIYSAVINVAYFIFLILMFLRGAFHLDLFGIFQK